MVKTRRRSQKKSHPFRKSILNQKTNLPHGTNYSKYWRDYHIQKDHEKMEALRQGWRKDIGLE